jgi:hypothetical protein
MATIRDTLKEIPLLQGQIEQEMDAPETLDSAFLLDLMNYTSVYYFDLLGHACMEQVRARLRGPLPNFLKIYYSNFDNPTMLEEYIRWQNIGGLFIVWVTFEKFIIRQHTAISGKKPGDVLSAHDKLLKKRGFDKVRRKAILKTFTGIRRTRNALHSDGVYLNEDGKDFIFTLAGEKYILKHGQSVIPLRILRVVREMLTHYKELNESARA